MASTDAKPVPQKNVAYRITFPIFDADGDLVTGATGLDSEVSKDAGTFTDCTNEATEIATSSGMYYLDLTSTEMNADTVVILVKTSSSGAKTTPIVLYPEETGDIRVNVTQMTNNVITPDTYADWSGPNQRHVYYSSNSTLTGTSLTLESGTSSIDNFYKDMWVMLPFTSSMRQMRKIVSYVGSTRTATLERAFNTSNGTVDAVLWTQAPMAIVDSELNAAILAAAYEGSETFKDFLRLARAALVGKASGLSGTTANFRDAADTKNRISATVDANGNRSAVTVDPT